MLKKLFKPKYVPYDAKYIALSAEDERNIRTITDDIKNYITRSDKASNVNYLPYARCSCQRLLRP